jgi:putative ABC transport system permease protein
MIRPRWRKVLHDLWDNKIRTILVMLSIAVGVFAVGWNTSTTAILLNDLDADYLSANPHSAILFSEPFGDEMVIAAQDTAGVAQAEGRSGLSARVLDPNGDWKPIQLVAIPPVDEITIDKIRALEKGDRLPPLGEREIFIERTGRMVLPVEAGDTVTLELPGQEIRQLRVAAVVHDVTAFSTVMSGQVNAYVSRDTMEWLGGSREYNQLYITVSERPGDEQHVQEVAWRVADRLESTGREVFDTFVFEPGQHPTKTITETLSVILGVLGGLTVFFSAFLVINTITALVSQHTEQIGVMKAVGGRTDQIVRMYLVLVLAFGVLALVVAVPLSTVASFGMINFLSDFLNFRPAGFRVPPISLALQTAVALCVPVLAALVPVLNGTRITIREAISDYGLGSGRFGQSAIDRLVEKVRGLPRPMLISLRNTFRRKARLVLTLTTLTLGGAIFIAVFNVRASLYVRIDEVLGYFLSDVNISLTRAHRLEKIEQLMQDVPGVVRTEGWGFESSRIVVEDSDTTFEVLVWAPPANSDLIEPVMTAGRWLVPEDENAIVITNQVVEEQPDLGVGDEVIIKVNEREYTWQVVGVAEMAANVDPPFVYTNYESLVEVLNQSDKAAAFRIVTASHDPQSQKQAAQALEERFGRAGIRISQITTGFENQQQQRVSIDVLVTTLMVMSILIALVGGIGLMGTMSMNVMERTREIGVMRSIGASNPSILWMVVVEGMTIGLFSWVLGSVLALPVTALLDKVIGEAFLTKGLDMVLAVDGFVVWLLGALAISAVASLLPARNAIRLTIREVLAYE